MVGCCGDVGARNGVGDDAADVGRASSGNVETERDGEVAGSAGVCADAGDSVDFLLSADDCARWNDDVRVCGSDTVPPLGERAPFSDAIRRLCRELGLRGDGRAGLRGICRKVDADFRCAPAGRATSVPLGGSADVLAVGLVIVPFVVGKCAALVDASPVEDTDFTSSS